jgi:outer membrane protein
MRSTVRATSVALVFSAVSAIAARAQATSLKVAYVNTEAIMAAAPGRVQAESLLSKEGQGYREQLQKLQDSLNTLETAYQKDEAKLTPAVKDAKQKTMQALANDIQLRNAQFQQQWNQRQDEVMAPVREVVHKVLDDIRTEDGYAMIFANDPQQLTIVASDKNLDITDRVIARLKSTSAPALPTAKAAPAAAAPAGVRPPKPPEP